MASTQACQQFLSLMVKTAKKASPSGLLQTVTAVCSFQMDHSPSSPRPWVSARCLA